jgi:hypothetical protein
MGMNEPVQDKRGRPGRIVPIPDDYTFASPADPLRMARLVYVLFDGETEAVLIPESRLQK